MKKLALFELLYGWSMRGPTQLLEGLMTGEDETQKSVIYHGVQMRNYLADVTAIVQEYLTTRKRKFKEWYDRNSVHREFGVGDEVLVLLPLDTSKMKAQSKGPYRVVQKINNVNYKVNVGGRRGIVTYHINLLRKYHRATLIVVSETDDIADSLQTPDFVKNESVNDIKFVANLSAIQRDQFRKPCATFFNHQTRKN